MKPNWHKHDDGTYTAAVTGWTLEIRPHGSGSWQWTPTSTDPANQRMEKGGVAESVEEAQKAAEAWLP